MKSATIESTSQIKGVSEPHFGIFAYGCNTDFASSENRFYAVISGEAHSISDETQSGKSLVSADKLLQLYKSFGDDVLKQLSGSYSFAILDKIGNKFIAAIDKFGTKPLAYTQSSSRSIIFGTTIDHIIAHPDVHANLDMQSIYNYTYFHVIPSPSTIYENVNKLEPSQCLTFANNILGLKYYWGPTFFEGKSYNKDELRERLLPTLKKSAETITINEQSGAFLSGGLDSSTVSGILSERTESPLNVFTMGFSEDGYDEISYARIAAKHFNLKLHEYYVTPNDIIEAIPKVARYYDEPFGNSSAIPTYVCARFAASTGIKTMYAGDGGDEIFAGNERYAKQKIFSMYDALPEALRKNIIDPAFMNSLTSKVPLLKKIYRYIEQASMPMPERMQSYNFMTMVRPQNIFQNDFLESINSRAPVSSLISTYNNTSAENILNKMLYLDWKFTLADNDLRKVSKMCELAGIDVHYPLLSDEIVHLSTQIPAELKLKGFNLRYYYKDALKSYLPGEIINKSKQGFGLPFGEWLKTSRLLQETVYDSLNNLASRDIYSKKFISELIDKHKKGHASYYGTMVWVLCMLEQWLYQHKK